MANAYVVDADYDSGEWGQSNRDLNNFAKNINMKSLFGVEGIPYQFLPSVDRRVGNANADSDSNGSTCRAIGRKYGQKIIERIPLLFLIPCEPVFMDDSSWSDGDGSTILESLLSGIGSDPEELLQGSGRYYYVQDATTRYYNYLNAMLTAVASYLGIADELVTVGETNNRERIGDVNWVDETSSAFKTYFTGSSANRNLVFYMDSIDSISESFSNDTTQSSLASTINGFSDKARELDFLFGSSAGGTSAISDLLGGADSIITTVGESLSGVANTIGGGIIGSISGNAGNILDGGKIVFPDIWSDSSYDKSYTISLKLRSPDNDSLSIFLNILKPYCKILALTLSHSVESDVNIYRTPFLVKAYCKGMFNIDMGIISGLSVNKGAQCAWNDDGLPTQIDIDIDIRDMYKNLSMTGYLDDGTDGLFFKRASIFTRVNQLATLVNNTAYMDFLANMAGLNINMTTPLRKAKMAYYLGKNEINGMESTISTRFGQFVDRHIAKLYNNL